MGLGGPGHWVRRGPDGGAGVGTGAAFVVVFGVCWTALTLIRLTRRSGGFSVFCFLPINPTHCVQSGRSTSGKLDLFVCSEQTGRRRAALLCHGVDGFAATQHVPQTTWKTKSNLVEVWDFHDAGSGSAPGGISLLQGGRTAERTRQDAIPYSDQSRGFRFQCLGMILLDLPWRGSEIGRRQGEQKNEEENRGETERYLKQRGGERQEKE
jgi:hypothetical protein